MSDTRILSRNPFDTLIQEHQRLRDLLEEYEDLDVMQIRERKQLLRHLEEEIAGHIQTQEGILFPALEQLNDTGISASIADRRTDHRTFHELLIDLREATTPLLYELAMIRLRFNAVRHLAAEESEIYSISSHLSRGVLDRLSLALDQRETGLWTG